MPGGYKKEQDEGNQGNTCLCRISFLLVVLLLINSRHRRYTLIPHVRSTVVFIFLCCGPNQGIKLFSIFISCVSFVGQFLYSSPTVFWFYLLLGGAWRWPTRYRNTDKDKVTTFVFIFLLFLGYFLSLIFTVGSWAEKSYKKMKVNTLKLHLTHMSI